jgi:hypothetical protein
MSVIASADKEAAGVYTCSVKTDLDSAEDAGMELVTKKSLHITCYSNF